MQRVTRWSAGFSLVLAGLAGIAFFGLTDPRWGWSRWSASADLIDAIHQSSPGTYIGVTGAGVIVGFGLWLMMRRSA